MKKTLVVFYQLALSYWIGSMAYFSFLFAPRVFKVLPRPLAGELQNALFPLYFRSLLIASIVVSVSGILLRLPRWTQSISAVSAAIFFYSSWKLSPAIRALGEAGMQSSEEFARLHKLSVGLNGAAFLLALVLAFAWSLRAQPKSS
jgi:hypothetical protein